MIPSYVFNDIYHTGRAFRVVHLTTSFVKTILLDRIMFFFSKNLFVRSSVPHNLSFSQNSLHQSPCLVYITLITMPRKFWLNNQFPHHLTDMFIFTRVSCPESNKTFFSLNQKVSLRCSIFSYFNSKLQLLKNIATTLQLFNIQEGIQSFKKSKMKK